MPSFVCSGLNNHSSKLGWAGGVGLLCTDKAE